MKTKTIFTLTLWLIMLSSQSQLFQKNYGHFNYLHDVSIAQLQGNSENLILAGNFFEPNFADPNMEICRIDHTSGNIIWQNYYVNPQGTFPIVRVFDIVAYTDQGGADMLAITGYVTKAGINYVFVAKIDENGNYMDASYYVSNIPQAVHTQGLRIIFTLNGPDGRGFVVGGFTNTDYDHQTNDVHKGFVMYVKEDNLMPMRTITINSTNPYDSQYDMVSDITETASGFCVTGSLGLLNPSLQQAVLCLGIDFNFNLRWTNSYFVSNSRDVGVDIYYDQGADEIYLLANYSSTNYFGVTVINDLAGYIINSKCWYAYDVNNTKRYGFTISESFFNSPGSLLIGGYIKDGEYIDEFGNLVPSQTIPFAYEFDKMTGNQLTVNYFYNIPHQDPGFTDYFDFWNTQMPLIYYPEMTLSLRDMSGYFLVGYRANTLANTVNAELIKTGVGLDNECYRTPYVISHNTLVIAPMETQIILEGPDYIDLDLVSFSTGYDLITSCPGLSVDESGLNFNLTISPNPARDRLYISMPDHGNVYYSIFDTKGIKTSEGKLNGGPEIDISELRPGIYFIKLLMNDNYITRKVIIE
jgi:hypothetical protein